MVKFSDNKVTETTTNYYAKQNNLFEHLKNQLLQEIVLIAGSLLG